MKSKIGTVEGKTKVIHSHTLNYWVWGLPHLPLTPYLHFLNLVEFKLSLALNTALEVALRLMVIIKNMTCTMQIAKAAPFCPRLECRLGPGADYQGVESFSFTFLVYKTHKCLCAKWKPSVGNDKYKKPTTSSPPITYTASIYLLPERVERCLSFIKKRLKDVSPISRKCPICFTD